MWLLLWCAAYVNGLREGWTAERPFEDGDCIMQELRGEGAVKEPLSVDAELALAQRELERVEAETRATAVAAAAAASLDPSDEGSSPSVEDTVAAAVQRHMVELGMRRYIPHHQLPDLPVLSCEPSTLFAHGRRAKGVRNEPPPIF